MTLQELQNQKRYVRVISAMGYEADEDAFKMIGGEYEVRCEYYFDGTVSVWNKNKSDHWVFNKSDVVELTPIEFNGRRIAIGDEINDGDSWYKVYDYDWYDGDWRLETVINSGDLECNCWEFRDFEIGNHRIPQDNDLDEQKCIDFLKSKGRIKHGLIVE